METADAITQRIADNYQNPRAGDETLIVRFEVLDVENEEKSKLAGHPVYEQVECVRIKGIGARDENVVHLKNERLRLQYASRFPRHYQAFKDGQSDVVHGFPLREWPPIQRHLAEAWAVNGIRTVEQLAGISDGQIHVLGHGGQKFRQKAREWLELAKSTAPVEALKAENASLKSELQVLARAVETLQRSAGIAPQPISPVALVAPEKPKRGRKPKSAVPEVTPEAEG